MTSLVPRSPEGQNLPAIRGGSFLIEYDPEAIRAGVDIEIAAKWAYDLGSSGKGVGIRGAEEGTRLLASRGEIIRVGDVVIVREDEFEALFNATATRFVIEPETGREVRLDSTTRGKRVPKIARHSEDWIKNHPRQDPDYFDDKWYEKGVAKATRNAALALMPSNVKSALLKVGLEAAIEEKKGRKGTLEAPKGQQAPASQQRASRPSASAPEPQRPAQAQQAPLADRETLLKDIDRMLLDCRNTWDSAAWLTLITGVRNKFAPKAAQFLAKDLPDEDLPKVIAYLREKRGESDMPGPAPAEDANTVDGEVVNRAGE